MPPVMATPLMAPMRGLETGPNGLPPSIRRASRPRHRGVAAGSLRSIPAQNAGSAPVKMITSTDSSGPDPPWWSGERCAGRRQCVPDGRAVEGDGRHPARHLYPQDLFHDHESVTSQCREFRDLGNPVARSAGRGQRCGGSLRAGVHDPTEVLAEVARRAEATLLRHSLDGEVAGLEEPLGEMDPLALQPLVGWFRWRPGTGGRRFGGSWRSGRPGLDGQRLARCSCGQ